MKFFLSLTVFANDEVRLFEEFNSFRRKWEFSITRIKLCVLIMVFSWTCFSSRSNLEVSCPNIVCYKWRQGCINLLGLIKFILSVARSCCIRRNNSTGSSNNGRICLNFRFISNHHIVIDVVWIFVRLLETHWIVRAFIFLFYS